jgi:hypothetical protein
MVVKIHEAKGSVNVCSYHSASTTSTGLSRKKDNF